MSIAPTRAWGWVGMAAIVGAAAAAGAACRGGGDAAGAGGGSLDARRVALALPTEAMALDEAMTEIDAAYSDRLLGAVDAGRPADAIDPALTIERYLSLATPAEAAQKDDPRFAGWLHDAGQAAGEAARAAYAGDAGALRRAADGLDAVCASCHKVFKKKAAAGG